MHHLSKQDAALSLTRQHKVLNADGIGLHSLWSSDELEEHHGLLFQQYTAESFAELLDEQFEVLESTLYAEMESGDSLYVVIKRLD
jgi:hypothetical protein